MNIYEISNVKPYSFSVNDTTLASEHSLTFRNSF